MADFGRMAWLMLGLVLVLAATVAVSASPPGAALEELGTDADR